MAPKRPLGLGRASKVKKQKKEVPSEVTPEQSNEIEVELSETADANDEVTQLRALWNTFQKSDKDNELVLNGIIHECDRLLRNSKESAELPDWFHSVYGLALADLAIFHTEDKEESKTVKDFFEAALERIDLGFETYPESIDLSFAKARTIINRIPLEFISQMDADSTTKTYPKISKLLDAALQSYEAAERKADEQSKYELFNEENLGILEALDDLLDMVDNFGHDNFADGLDSDEEEEEAEEIELSKKHPLYGIKTSDKYNQWWRDHILVFLANVDKQPQEAEIIPLRREICKRIGQSYLQESEEPVSIFTTLEYDSDNEEEEIDGLSSVEAQKIGIELVSKAIEFLKQAEDSEEPQSWVDIAEAQITLGNIHDNESKEQEKIYKDAEKRLIKANNATHGRYDNVLKNLQEN